MRDVYRQRFGGDIPELEPEPNWRSFEPGPAWEQRLWALIDIVNLGVPIEEAVAGYTRSELILLQLALERISNRLEEQLAETFGEDPSGMGWEEVAVWIVGKGNETIEHVLHHPEEPAPTVPPDEPWLTDLLEEVYQQRYRARWPMLSQPRLVQTSDE